MPPSVADKVFKTAKQTNTLRNARVSVRAWIAQLVEHFPEEEGVPSSSLGPSTTESTSGNIVVMTLLVSLVALEQRGDLFPRYNQLMFQKTFLWVQKYERHLSAVAMVTGFIVDSLFFERVDLWQTQIVFAAYTAICFVTIPLLHWFETRDVERPRWRSLLTLGTQFALGGFWSGFLIFYFRSADLGASWFFILFLAGVLLANEYFSRYHDRVVFTSVLFFFALYSYAIFAVPIYTGTLGTITFLESGIVAIAIFFLFVRLLHAIARERFATDLKRIRIGAGVVVVLMNIFYFTNILPPLPLAAPAAGVYHSVWRVPGNYMATSESQGWQVRYLGFSPTLHITPGESLFAYSSIFAPTTLTTRIVHRWYWQNPTSKKWIPRATISYPIVGGRDGGYRGYSTARITETGKWRVSIETVDGRRITQLSFMAVPVAVASARETITLP
jgi:hypothetical protein